LLIASFLEHFAAKHKRRRKTMSAEALRLCQRFPWPGNVRQLRNLMERLVVTCRNSTIELEDMPEELRDRDQSATTFTVRAGMSLAEAEKLLIRRTLTHVTDNREEAARVLGISRRALQYKLKEYGLMKEHVPTPAPPPSST
jgi:DNA-binding NtrC family response regulator